MNGMNQKGAVVGKHYRVQRKNIKKKNGKKKSAEHGPGYLKKNLGVVQRGGPGIETGSKKTQAPAWQPDGERFLKTSTRV